jgi:hypothetical protein
VDAVCQTSFALSQHIPCDLVVANGENAFQIATELTMKSPQERRTVQLQVSIRKSIDVGQ